jgi:hypothetical protein
MAIIQPSQAVRCKCHTNLNISIDNDLHGIIKAVRKPLHS